MDKKILIYGTGGHAKVIHDIIDSHKTYEVIAYFDDKPEKSSFQGVPVLHSMEELQKLKQQYGHNFFITVAIGQNAARKKVFLNLKQAGYQLPALAHKSANLSSSVKIGDGSVVMPGANINSDSVIGEACIINTGANIDHDCKIHDFVHIAPGTTLCGNIEIGADSFVGAGSTIIPNLKIATGVVLGAGSVVVSSITDSDTKFVGVPAKVLKK